jgi:hypothetical protein
MRDRFVFMDESGDLGEHGSAYFVMTAIWIDHQELFDRLIKNVRRNKFKRELRGVQELKANNSSASVREYLLKQFSAIASARGQSVILDKKRLFSHYLRENKNQLYNYVAGVLASTLDIDAKKLTIRIDKSKGKQSLRDDFDQYFRMKCQETKWNRDVEIHHSWSHAWSGLQIADFVSWAVFQKFEHKNDYYYQIIKAKLIIDQVWR